MKYSNELTFLQLLVCNLKFELMSLYQLVFTHKKSIIYTNTIRYALYI